MTYHRIWPALRELADTARRRIGYRLVQRELRQEWMGAVDKFIAAPPSSRSSAFQQGQANGIDSVIRSLKA